MFAQRGFHAASVESIAESAGLAAGTIYLYFDDKDSLYIAVLTAKLGEMSSRIEARSALAADPIDAIRCAVLAELEFHVEHPAFFEIFCRQVPPGSGGKYWNRVSAAFEQHIGLLQSLVEAAKARQLLSGSSRRLAAVLAGITVQVTREIVAGDQENFATGRADEAVELFLYGASGRREAA